MKLLNPSNSVAIYCHANAAMAMIRSFFVHHSNALCGDPYYLSHKVHLSVAQIGFV